MARLAITGKPGLCIAPGNTSTERDSAISVTIAPKNRAGLNFFSSKSELL
jgi:hypothetical protein